MMNKRSHSQEETPISASTGATMEEETKEDNTNKRAKVSSDGGADNDWEAFFQKLVSYKQHHGHCNVPAQNDDDPELGIWVAKQRELHKNAETHTGHNSSTEGEEALTEDQMAKLTQIGFEWQPRNPRHLQWETRFSQLQSFKKKYGHAQVPIGWPENVQLANWVSKQRQEYKNLLRGRTTRLDENRIRLLNSIGFAWQLQRGGRRRQLKARAKDDRGKQGANAGSDGEASAAGSDKDQGEDKDGPCILPGEVLIGQGASTPMSPSAASGSAAAAGSPGLMRPDGAAKKLRDGQSKGAGGAGVNPFAAPGGGMAHQQGGPAQSPLGQPLRQSLLFQQIQQQQQMAPSSMTQNAMGLPFMGGNQAGIPGNNNELLEYMLARNALYQNLQRPQASARSSLQMLGAAGASAFSRMNAFPGQNGQAPLLSASQQSQLLAAQRSSLLPMLGPGASFYPGDVMGSAGLGAGAGMDPLPTRRSMGGSSAADESKMPMGARGFAEDQQQQQQYLPNLLRFSSSGGGSGSSRMDAPGASVSPNIGSLGMRQQQQQSQGGNQSYPNNFSS